MQTKQSARRQSLDATTTPLLAEAKPPLSAYRRARLVAALSGCDIRTAERALNEGVDAVKGHDLRERLSAALTHVDAVGEARR